MEATEVRVLETHGEFQQAIAVFEEIWSFEPGKAPVSDEVLLTHALIGNYVAGAFSGGRMVGASLAFRCASDHGGFFSYITGTLPGTGAGTALKRHQRDWAIESGIEQIVWTFDPLIRRNAYFNLVKLGAYAADYRPNYYGPLGDAINAGDESDRLWTVWDLSSPAACAAARDEFIAVSVPPGTETALVSRDGWPERRETSTGTVLVEIPEDIEQIRKVNPQQAAAWRKEVRETLGALVDDSAVVRGFYGRAAYVVERGK
ncbi:hypothetical protein GCM10022221_50360 [Actinocorallia aurea]